MTTSRAILALPVAAFLAAGALTPIAVLIALSFYRIQDFGLVPALDPRAWIELAGSDVMLWLIAKACLYGAAMAAATPFLAYPIALAMARLPLAGKGIAVIVLLTPLYMGEIVRIYAWRLILGAQGLINSVLTGLGLVDEPVRELLYSSTSILIVMFYNTLPFMVIAIWAGVETVDRRLFEAARDMGARTLQVFWRLTLPLTWSGLMAGMIVVFALAAGDALTPSLMGGTEGTTAMTMIDTLFGTAFDWPLASALALGLLLALLVCTALIGAAFVVPASRRRQGR